MSLFDIQSAGTWTLYEVTVLTPTADKQNNRNKFHTHTVTLKRLLGFLAWSEYFSSSTKKLWETEIHRHTFTGGWAGRVQGSLNPSQAAAPQGPNTATHTHKKGSDWEKHTQTAVEVHHLIAYKQLCVYVCRIHVQRDFSLLHYTHSSEAVICWSKFLNFMQPISARYRTTVSLKAGKNIKHPFYEHTHTHTDALSYTQKTPRVCHLFTFFLLFIFVSSLTFECSSLLPSFQKCALYSGKATSTLVTTE